MSSHKKHPIHLSIICLFILSLLAILFAESSCAFEQIIKEVNSVKQMTVKVQHHKGVFWQANIHNKDLQLPVKILWDESLYTSSSGRSSRLIREGVSDIHPSQQQTPNIILAQKTTTILFTSEDLLPYADKDLVPTPSNPSAQGALTLALIKNGKRLFWKGSVQFIDQKKGKQE